MQGRSDRGNAQRLRQDHCNPRHPRRLEEEGMRVQAFKGARFYRFRAPQGYYGETVKEPRSLDVRGGICGGLFRTNASGCDAAVGRGCYGAL